METFLSPYFLEVKEILEKLESVNNKRVSNYLKKEFRLKYEDIFNRKYANTNKQKLELYEGQVVLNFKTDKDDYLYWLSLKLSIIWRFEIQVVLNYGHNNYFNDNFKEAVNEVVLPLLLKWKWVSKKNINEVKNWLIFARDINNSIFNSDYLELILFELLDKLKDYELWDDLVGLLMHNSPPSKKIPLFYNSVLDFCVIFSILKKKNKINLSYSMLAIWLESNFVIYSSNNTLISASTDSIETYLGKKYPVPENLKTWF